MPSYVIIERREFEELFEKVEQEGDKLTALNASTKNSSRRDARFSLSKPYEKDRHKRSKNKENRKRRKREKSSDNEESKNTQEEIRKRRHIDNECNNEGSKSDEGEKSDQTSEICETERESGSAVRNYGFSTSSESD